MNKLLAGLLTTLSFLLPPVKSQSVVEINSNLTGTGAIHFGNLWTQQQWSTVLQRTNLQYNAATPTALVDIGSTPTSVGGYTQWERSNAVHSTFDHPDWVDVGGVVTFSLGGPTVLGQPVAFGINHNSRIRFRNTFRPSDGTLRLEIYQFNDGGLVDIESTGGFPLTLEVTLPDLTVHTLSVGNVQGLNIIQLGPDAPLRQEVIFLEIPLSVTTTSWTDIRTRIYGGINTRGDNIFRTRKYGYNVSYWPEASPISIGTPDGRLIPAWHTRSSANPTGVAFHGIQDTTNTLLESLPRRDFDLYFWSIGPPAQTNIPLTMGCEAVVELFHPLTFSQIVIPSMIGTSYPLETNLLYLPRGYGDWVFQWFAVTDGAIVSSKPFHINSGF